MLHVEAAFKVRSSSVLQEDELCGLAIVQIKLFLPLNGLRNLKWLQAGVIFAVVTIELMLTFP